MFEGISYLDVAYLYSGKRRDQNWKKWDEQFKSATGKSLTELMQGDIYAIAEKKGLLASEERNWIDALIGVRNAWAHFNPWEISLRRYHESLKKFGARPADSRQTISELVLLKTAELLVEWFSRLFDFNFEYEIQAKRA